ncbi:MAG: M1 family peptidase [Bacteroidetes bacterium]|nr:M1 family peptidase [Bacteroidota bacterium]
MFKKLPLIAFLLPLCLSAQVSNYKDYWKNRKPNAAYWQQDVHYTIDALIDDTKDEITGTETLEYFNNSPDELTTVYFHLYQNAFQPGSYAQALEVENDQATTFGKYEALKMGTVIEELKIAGEITAYKIDNTILIAQLKTPLKPNESITFNIKFKTYWDNGSMRRRFKTFTPDGINKHFDGVHWYPRICVYDRKFGWETDQHLGKEFYGDYGVYDVKLTFPSKYVLEATGALQNESSVMPADLRKALDIENYSKIITNDKGQKQIIPSGYKFKTPIEGTKTWIYHAENVHDFAFTADPTYRIGEVIWNGIRCIALAQEQNAPYWRPTAQFVADVVSIYSKDIGMYGYPKIVAADARDGMEYPMITLNGGNWPGHQYVIAHEVGHNWFFGMIGNNETYRAMMDEGFTQFLTSWSIKKINNISMHANTYDEGAVYNGYLTDALNKNDAQLNTHSDDFTSALGHGGGYRHVYYKTATMLYNLQYTLGDELFLKAMQHYFNQWKFAHPYPDDFRQSIIDYTHVDLNWFFDQWMESTKSIDYKITKIKKIGETKDGKYYYTVSFKRKGEMQMPIDFTVTDKLKKQYNFTIPNTYFAKNDGKQVLKTWKGWGLLNQSYTDTIILNNKLIMLEIDTTNRLADIYRMDNVKIKNNYKLPLDKSFNNGVAKPTTFNKRNMQWRPDAWFNAVDGLKAGINYHHDYAKVKHVLDFTIWYNIGIGAEKKYDTDTRDILSYKLKYSNLVGKNAFIYWDTRILDGIFYDDLGFEKTFGKDYINIHFKSISMVKGKGIYWEKPALVSREEKTNSSVMIDYTRKYKYLHGNGTINSGLRGSALTRDYGFGSLKIEVLNNNNFGKFEFKTRFFATHIEGTNIAPEVLLNLSGANMEQLLESKFTRSRGWIPEEWTGYGTGVNHFQMGGGLNLRGYAGYLAPSKGSDGNTYALFQGTTGASGSIEIDFDQYFRLKPRLTRNWLHIDAYLFGDIGIIGDYRTPMTNGNQGITSQVRADAGIGSALNIYRWGKRNLIKPFTLRFDMPFILNTPPFTSKGYIENRWVVGLGRCF